MGTTVVTFKKPLASSRHVTWWIKGAKILDILPRYPANMYRFYGTFFVWRCTEYSELREKLRCQELQNIWSECVALNSPTMYKYVGTLTINHLTIGNDIDVSVRSSFA